MNERVAHLNHLAAGILVAGASLILIGQLVRYKATSIEVRTSKLSRK